MNDKIQGHFAEEINDMANTRTMKDLLKWSTNLTEQMIIVRAAIKLKELREPPQKDFPAGLLSVHTTARYFNIPIEIEIETITTKKKPKKILIAHIKEKVQCFVLKDKDRIAPKIWNTLLQIGLLDHIYVEK